MTCCARITPDEGGFDLALAALTASGASQREMDGYLARIEALCRQVPPQSIAAEQRKQAEALFNMLWRTRPNRYQYHGPFRLTHALRAQLGDTPGPVGNCLGLTLLFNVLALRLGLKVRAGHLEMAFGRGPHVFTILETAQGSIDIENIFAHGFDYAGHQSARGRQEWSDRELVADVYNSAAGQLFEAGDLAGALTLYDRAIVLNPGYSKAYLNKGMALSLLGRAAEAEECLVIGTSACRPCG